MYNLKSLRVPKNTQSGIAEHVLIAKKEWFAPGGIKTPVAPFNTLADSVTVKQQHVFKPGFGFLYFQLAPAKNSFKGSTPGDLGSKRKTYELTIFVPGVYEEVDAILSDLLNTPLVTLAKDSDCGIDTRYMFGNECIGSWLGWEETSGTTVDGVKGYLATITFDGPKLFYKAPGDITMMPETVAGAPVITSQPVDITLQAGGTIALVVGVNNALSFQWKKDGVNIAGAIDHFYTKAGAVSGDSGTYTCIVTNANGSTTSDPAVITVV